MNENRELYVDLQLDDWIQPDDDFPVGVTTGRILQEDWRPQSGLIINRKTTSWDYSRLITASDWNLYVDLGDWVWYLLGGEGIDCNVRRFLVTDLQGDTEVWQQMVNWYLEGKYPIIVYRWESYILEAKPMSNQLRFYDIHSTVMHLLNQGYSYSYRNALYATWDVNNEFQGWLLDEVQISPSVLATDIEYQTPYVPQYPWSPTTKNYVDTELLKKQDLLTPWTRITIQTDPNTGDLVISADISGVMTYMWNVTDASQLPTTGQNQWDCWYSELEKTLYAWDGTQWNDIGGTGIDLTNYFNMQVNDSDDITEGSTNLFVTSTEKNIWNNKQDPLTAWTNIQIDSNNVISATDTTYTAWDGINIDVNNVISNTAKFDPSNAGSMWQFLKKTNDGYQWADIPWWWASYTAWDWININNSNVISNTKPFDPTNTATVGYVLKASGRDSYYRAPESGWWWGGGNFNPQTSWQPWQILTKGSWNTYDWKDLELPSGENNVKFWTINSHTVGSTPLQEIYEWVSADANNWAIINDTYTNDVYVYNKINNSWATPKAIFFWVKRNSAIKEWISGDTSHWYYTVQWQTELDIIVSWQQYGIMVRENPDDDTHTNYVSALWANYPSPFMPTEWTQPATKAYVDAVAAGSVSVSAITNNTTGTTYTVSQEWVGTQAQYNAITPVNWVIYNIIPSS